MARSGHTIKESFNKKNTQEVDWNIILFTTHDLRFYGQLPMTKINSNI